MAESRKPVPNRGIRKPLLIGYLIVLCLGTLGTAWLAFKRFVYKEPLYPCQMRAIAGQHGAVEALAYSRDGRFLASGGTDGRINVWDIQAGGQVASIQAHSEAIFSLALSPDGKTLGSGDWSGEVRLWEVGSWRQIAMLGGNLKLPANIAISPDNELMAVAPNGKVDEIAIWSMRERRIITKIRIPDPPIYSGIFARDGLTLLCLCGTGWIRIVKTKTWELDHAFRAVDLPAGLEGFEVQTSTVGKDWFLLHRYGSKEVWLVDKHGLQGARCITSPWERFLHCAASEDGLLLVTVGGDQTKESGELRLWEAESGRLIAHIHTPPIVIVRVAIAPDGKSLATGSLTDGSIQLWDMDCIRSCGPDDE